ncbi:MAG: DNA polymerase III subunit alpha [Verrucomicrobia bacterium]|nr:DNA polymerase III subunit alpha [Verrucomicrobiota bacterium]
MAADPFVHLHLHTHYSTLDGAVQAGPLMKAAKADGMPAVAITDHGNMFGAIEFYRAAQKAGVKPILGCEVYMAPGSRHDRSAGSARDAAYHFTLLAETAEGYQNLSKLVSAGFLEGYYYKPRIDKEILARHAKGLIALSGCLKGEVNMLLSQAKHAQAKAAMAELRDIFGRENLFVELHNHGLSLQRQNNPQLVELAREFGLGLVAANDVHFLERSHHESHDVLVCIGTGANVADTKRMHYSPELYFKRSAEMRELFAELPEACDNTLRIAERCNVTIEFGKPKYPEFTPPDGKGRVEYLRELTWAGLEQRFGERARTDQDLRGRLEYELGVLEKSGFTSYFLIVWDFIHHARQHGIPVGPGRGSAAGSLVAYALGITDIDPIRFQLLFERFLNPERVSPPDIDVDFCQTRRSEVIDYVRQKYGESRVGQIITFGTLSSKAVLKDVNRVLGGSFADGDRLSKLIPLKGQIPYDLPEAIQINKELKGLVENDAQVKTIWQHATVLEGLVRGTGVHAAGVVIGSEDLTNFVPLARDKDGQVITQFDGNTLNDLGLLKMDFLGLKTLTLIEDALTLIRARRAPDFDINTIPFDDPATVEMLNRGETIGVFQLESGGMVNLCRQFDLVGLDDIIALIALYRPGPMELIPDYIARKKGKTKIKYAHPLLEKVCADTFGIMIYQEQVMAAANLLAGYSLGGADMLRRAMGKKDVEKMKQERSKFIEGCWKTNEIGPDKANEIFDLLEKFAGYGFNRSHSAAYGWVSWQTAYLKANFPVEFMAATLSNAIQASDATEKISVFVAECRRMNLEILPPDVNRSSLKFVPEGEDGIRFGLAGIKGVGEAAVSCILEERDRKGPFASLDDFCLRLDSKLLNKKLLESLVKCGAFDAFGEPRERAFARLDQVVSTAQRTQREKAIGQFSLFEDFGGAPGGGATVGLNEVTFTLWGEDERLGFEKELLGFYLSGHPLEAYRELIEKDKYRPLANIAEVEDRGTFHAIVWIADVQKKFAKKDNRPFAVVFIEDLATQIEATVWSESFEKHAALLEPKKVLQVRCRVDRRGEEPKVSLDDFKPVKAPAKKPEGAKPVRPRKPKAVTTPLRLRFEVNDALPSLLDQTHGALSEFPGTQPVEFELALADGRILVCRAHAGLKVDARPELTERLAACLG